MIRTTLAYESAFVLDMLANVGPSNLSDNEGRPLSAEMLENARASGITGCNLTVGAVGAGPAVFGKTTANIAFWEREILTHNDVLMRVLSVADLREAKRSGRLGIMFGLQDGTMFEDTSERVRVLYDLGVRIMQFTYNGRNLLGDGCLEQSNGGLTAFGHECVHAMNELGVLVDLSHVGMQTSWDTLRASRNPVAVTHGGAHALSDVPRNKPDDLLKAIADGGGVVGIYLMPYLRPEGQPHASDFMRHLEHVLNLCGEDHVGVGSDLSTSPIELTSEYRTAHAEAVCARRRSGIGAPSESEAVFPYVPEFNSSRRMALIADAMAGAGYSAACVDKVIGKNWMRILGEVWNG